MLFVSNVRYLSNLSISVTKFLSFYLENEKKRLNVTLTMQSIMTILLSAQGHSQNMTYTRHSSSSAWSFRGVPTAAGMVVFTFWKCAAIKILHIGHDYYSTLPLTVELLRSCYVENSDISAAVLKSFCFHKKANQFHWQLAPAAIKKGTSFQETTFYNPW